jgi:hypothetical protein
MADAAKLAAKVPGWVERILIPTLESRVRSIVKEEVGHLEKTTIAKFDEVDAKFDAVDSKFEAKFDTLSERLDSLRESITITRDIADLKARMTVVEKRTSG